LYLTILVFRFSQRLERTGQFRRELLHSLSSTLQAKGHGTTQLQLDHGFAVPKVQPLQRTVKKDHAPKRR